MKQDFVLDIKKAALLVIDMQKYFCDNDGKAYVPGADILKKKIQDMIDVFSNADQPIIFTRHLDTQGSLMEKWWKENLKENDPQSKITEDFDTGKGEILKKHQYDAFQGTDLEKTLRKMGVKQLVICGVLTNLCCESTARSAFMRGFEVYFVTDATATYKKEMYDGTLLNLSYGFAILVKTNEVISI
ncbi:MAG: isochorismatase family protein [bacterium]